MTDQAAPAPAIARSLFAFVRLLRRHGVHRRRAGNKQVALGPLAVEAGIFAFLMLVTTSSAVAELHGQDDRQAPGRVRLRAADHLAAADARSSCSCRPRTTWTRRGWTPSRLIMGGDAADLDRRDHRLWHFDPAQRHHLQPAEGPAKASKLLWLRAGDRQHPSADRRHADLHYRSPSTANFRSPTCCSARCWRRSCCRSILVPPADLCLCRARPPARCRELTHDRCGIASGGSSMPFACNVHPCMHGGTLL